MSSAVPDGAGSTVGKANGASQALVAASRSFRPSFQCMDMGEQEGLSGLKGHAEARHCPFYETALASCGRSQQGPDLFPFWCHLLRLHRILGESAREISFRFPMRRATAFPWLLRTIVEAQGRAPAVVFTPRRNIIDAIRASVTGPRFIGQWHGHACCTLRISSALRRITSRTAPSMALSGENIMIDRTSSAGWPKRSTRPSRCWCRVGFHDKS